VSQVSQVSQGDGDFDSRNSELKEWRLLSDGAETLTHSNSRSQVWQVDVSRNQWDGNLFVKGTVALTSRQPVPLIGPGRAEGQHRLAPAGPAISQICPGDRR